MAIGEAHLIRITLYRAPGTLVASNNYKNEVFDGFYSVLRGFLKDSSDAMKSKQIRVAVFAVAGPVSNNRAELTNRGTWVIDGAQLALDFHWDRVSVINDFVAVGNGLLTLEDEEKTNLNPEAVVVKSGPIACLGSGTGLGECYLTSDSSKQSFQLT